MTSRSNDVSVGPEALGPTWLGANFWSRVGGPRMWSRYDAETVRRELEVLAEHGCTVTRSFCFWPDFVPEPEQLDLDAVDRLIDFLDAHTELGLATIPTFIVGHMSGENWDPIWRDGRDLYRDSWLVSQQAWFAAEIARRTAQHPAIAGWIVSNEMPLYGGVGTTEEITAWARAMIDAVRAAGANQPISLGDGAWGVEVSGHDNGYSLRALAPLVDFIGPHVYPMQDDQVRQALAAACACELAAGFGKPVILEEFGVSSDFAADDHAAAYYRQVLYTTLLAGARGWLAWCNSDYDDLRNEDPYRHHTFELHFGLTDSRGRPKPQLESFASFSRLVARLSETGWKRVAGEVALVVPEHFERELPFTSPSYREDIRDVLLQSYVAAREADLPVAMLRERDGLAHTARLYLSPCSKLLTAPGLDRLRELATGGATVYLSYFAGSTANQRGPWLTWLEEIFGLHHRLRYGLVDPIEDGEASAEFVEPLGDIAAGTTLSFAVAGEPSARSYLPVETAGASVVAVDRHGRPLLLRHRLGHGSTFFCTYPIEYMAAKTPHVNPEDTWRLYSALALEAGVSRLVHVADPRIIVGRVHSGHGEEAIFVNSSPATVEFNPILAPEYELDPGLAGGSLRLEAFSVATVRRADISGAEGPPSETGGTPLAVTREGRDAAA